MAISPVKKINLIALQKNEEKIINLIHSLGFVHLINNSNQTVSGENQVEYKLAQVIFAINFLSQFAEDKTSLKAKLSGSKIELTEDKLDEILSSFNLDEVISKCEDYEEELNNLKNTLNENQARLVLLKPWQKSNYLPQAEFKTTKTKTFLGVINLVKYEELKTALRKKQNIAYEKITTNDREVYLAVSFSLDLEVEIKNILAKFDFRIAQFPEIKADEKKLLPAEIIEKLEKDNRDIDLKIKNLLIDIRTLLGNLTDLKIIADYYSNKKAQEDVKKANLKTKKTFQVMFWIEKTNLKVLEKELAKINVEYVIEVLKPSKEDSIPVKLVNSKVFEPFESVTNVYGMPLPDEPDPTPYLAPFFFIFFGFCVSDAGYGLLITVLMLMILKFVKLPREDKKLFKLLVLGGISTLIAGALFGSWFGIDITKLATDNWFRKFALTFKVIDPVKEPITVMLVAFAMGIIQIMTGLFIDTYWKFKHDQKQEAILGSGLWFMELLFLSLWILSKVGFILSSNTNKFFTYLVIAGAVGLVLAGSRKTKNIFLKIPIGLYSLYDVISYISDTLSYSRLLALGLATGIIAMVINLIAKLAIDMVPYVGYVLAVLILIGGHAFNIGINALGAFIHSGRLQFVEFFPKFMEGGGIRFNAFKRKFKYIRLINKN